MPKAFTEQERTRIRARLIAAGKKALNRGSMRHLVIDELAREAGISKGSFYSFFPLPRGFHPHGFRSLGVRVSKLAPGRGERRQRISSRAA